jgi:hypothetical protein
MLRSCYVVFAFIAFQCTEVPAEKFPSWFNEFLEHKALDKQYNITVDKKPTAIEADFNRDGTPDIAVLVTEKVKGRKGILVVHGKSTTYHVFGAGKDFGSGGDDFKWLAQWSLYTSKTASETLFDEETGDILGGKEIKLAGPAILVEDYEDGAAVAGGIIYWNGKQYIWIHQGE